MTTTTHNPRPGLTITENNYKFDNLYITKTRYEDEHQTMKFISVMRQEGDNFVELSSRDADYQRALTLSINEDNGY
jgi:hypothetical protein